jgi:hypothetical protein
MRRLLVVAVLSTSLFTAIPRDGGEGGWLNRLRHYVQHVVRHLTSNGDWLTPPKP